LRNVQVFMEEQHKSFGMLVLFSRVGRLSLCLY